MLQLELALLDMLPSKQSQTPTTAATAPPPPPPPPPPVAVPPSPQKALAANVVGVDAARSAALENRIVELEKMVHALVPFSCFLPCYSLPPTSPFFPILSAFISDGRNGRPSRPQVRSLGGGSPNGSNSYGRVSTALTAFSGEPLLQGYGTGLAARPARASTEAEANSMDGGSPLDQARSLLYGSARRHVGARSSTSHTAL